MSELEKQAHIRLSINQDVFIDSVLVQDTVADATVSTEVTSFEKSGSLYVLEGAVVFTGYVSRNFANSAESSSWVDQFPGLDTASPAAGQNFHYRMPFVLKVPVGVQPRGLVNVASRITQWEMDVVGDGWLHVETDLTIVGLNGNGGYEFQCGTQLVGSLEGPSSRPAENSSLDSSKTDRVQTEDNLNLALARGNSPDKNENSESNIEKELQQKEQLMENPKEVEQVSTARGGLPLSQEEVVERSELAHLDRKVVEQPASAAAIGDGEGEESTSGTTVAVETSRVERSEVSQSVADGWSDEATSTPPVSEFDFQHQVNFHAGTSSIGGHMASPLSGQNPLGPEALRVHLGISGMDEPISEQTDARPDAGNEWLPSADDIQRGEGKKSENLWSFVDFNAPEKTYALRFLIITEQETVAAVAQRLACSETELVQINHLTTGAVTAGQILQIPS